MATITPNKAFVLGHVLTSKTTKSITTIPLFSVIRTRPRCMQKKGQDSVQQKEQDSVACSRKDKTVRCSAISQWCVQRKRLNSGQ